MCECVREIESEWNNTIGRDNNHNNIIMNMTIITHIIMRCDFRIQHQHMWGVHSCQSSICIEYIYARKNLFHVFDEEISNLFCESISYKSEIDISHHVYMYVVVLGRWLTKLKFSTFWILKFDCNNKIDD